MVAGANGDAVEVQQRDAQPVLSIRGAIPVSQLGETMGERIPALLGYLQQSGARAAGPVFVRYHTFGAEETDMEIGVPVTEAVTGEGQIAASELPGGRAIATDFVQTYTPNGFTSGEKESGQLALAVPDCLRWDYEEPFPKGFLLCGEIAYQWTPGEPTGRRIQVEARQQAGLDLFLLPVAALQERYLATVEPKGELIEVEQARLALDAATLRPRWLAYSDLEGNRSRFDFSAYRTLADRDAFTPPPEVDWRDERPPHI
jgi:hypothetical protein